MLETTDQLISLRIVKISNQSSRKPNKRGRKITAHQQIQGS